MANIVECTSPEFRGLVNPYTGLPMTVKMVITPDGSVFFHDPDTYSTTQPFGTVVEAHRMWTRVDGVFGCRPDDVPAKCAYTGELLTPCDDGSYSGGFDPTVFHTRDEFLYYATMRDGHSKYPKPGDGGSQSRVTSAPETTPMVKSHAPEYVEGALETAEKVLKKSGFKAQRKAMITAGVDLKKDK